MGIGDVIGAVDRSQQRSRLALPFAVVRKFSDDGAGNLAALLAYRGFFSLFPLLLVFVTVLGFVLQGDSSAQRTILHSTLGQFPIIGNQLRVHSLGGSGVGLAVGIAGSIWAGLGITQAAQTAFDTVWAVPYKRRRDFLRSRLRGLLLLAVLGPLNIASSAVSGLAVSGGTHRPLLTIAAIAGALIANFALFYAAFRLLTSESVAEPRELLPGTIVAAIGWLGLQVLGGLFIGHVVKQASETYGLFALVIGLLTWLHLGAQLTLYAAEVNVVRARRLWPRSLTGIDTAGDREVLTAIGEAEERHDRQDVEVTFRDGG
jgi:YihY family inner membrane protein